MNDTKLAVLCALEKAIKDPVKDAKADARDEISAMFNINGVTSRQLLIDGKKVGTVSYIPPKTTVEINPMCEREALEYLVKKGLARVQPVNDWQNAFECVGFEVVDKETGEMVPCLYAGTKAGYASIRIPKPTDVFDAVRPMLDDRGVFGLLEDGE